MRPPSSHGGRRALALLLALLLAPLVLLPGAALSDAPQSPADRPDSAHLAAHRALERRYDEALARSPAAAMAFAQTELAKTRSDRDDQTRADALELVAQADLAAELWTEGLPLIETVVRIRRAARPPDHELLALALTVDATFLVAVDRAAEGDARVSESLQEWRRAFGANDIRLAQKLEAQAVLEQSFGRDDWTIELLTEAVKIRRANPVTAPRALPGTLTELGVREMQQGFYSDADAHLAQAQTLLTALLPHGAGDTEAKAMLVQVLVLRSGLFARLADAVAAERLARQAEAITFPDRYSQIDMHITVLEALETEYVLTDNLDAAIVQVQNIIATIRANIDLFDERRSQPALDRGLLADSLLDLSDLYLQKRDLPAAQANLKAASNELSEDSSALHFARAKIWAQAGEGAKATDEYRAALKMRKEAATEMSVLFGTNRANTSALGAPGAPAVFAASPQRCMTLGVAEILVPGAQMSTAWLKRSATAPIPVGDATNAEALLVRSVRSLEPAEWTQRAQGALKAARLDPDAVLIFVHGFNVTFEAAVQRAAQLRRDLNFDGPVAVFSWPSRGSMFRYGTDRQTADESAACLRRFIDAVAAATGTAKIHIVAHSMGNRVLLQALANLVQHPPDGALARLGQIVLAAPAVPEREFDSLLDVLTPSLHGHFTLYASRVDRAMWAGFLREGFTTLAGYSAGGRPLTHAGMQSIDITRAASGDLRELNHDVFASNPVMMEDIRQLIHSDAALPPERRLPNLLTRKTGPDGAVYWAYEPAAVLSGPANPAASH